MTQNHATTKSFGGILKLAIRIIFLSLILTACGSSEEEIPSPEQLKAMTNKDGSELFKEFITEVEDYEKSKSQDN